MTDGDLAAHAQGLLDANRYLTLATADPDGRPWTSPVYFASEGREFYWVSMTDPRHSRNLAGRPQVSIVVFDSTVAPYHGRAVYAVGEPANCPATTWTGASRSIPGRVSGAGHRSPATR